MANNETVYKLRCSLLGHTLDVRAIAVGDNGDIVTASRDQTAKLWQETVGNSSSYEEKVTYEGHTGFVTSVCLIPPNEESADGFTVTGSKDSTILVFQRNSSQPSHTLTGHTDTVSCVIWKNELLVSGSWDHSIRIWKDWSCIRCLEGHTGPVWSLGVVSIENSEEYFILSASADKTLKCWKNDQSIVTYSGHTDCVRGLAIVDSEIFLSCSNDASVRLWNLSGEDLSVFYGHTSFIYSISSFNSSNDFVTGGEDRSIRIWDGLGNNNHTIYLPAQSVWCVAVLPNSDVVAGSSDGVCRIFTRAVDRQADGQEQSEFEESLAKFKVAVEDVGGIKKTDLPDKTRLFQPGKRDGQTLMIRDGDKVLCYSWSASKGQWDAVGEVVGGAGGSASTSGKVLHEGREYDYVFDVDLDEGRSIKLPYNRGEDPWIVAQAFIHRHELPQDCLDQIANFVITNANVNSQSLGGQPSGYCDPFTGQSRYVPSSGTEGAYGSDGGADPFTGGGRYIPSFSLNSSSQSASPVSSQYFPQLIPLKFEAVNKSGILSKLEESNSLVEDPLTPQEISKLVEAVTSPNVKASELNPLEKSLQWPPERVWPVLDILRLALRSKDAHELWLQNGKGEAIANLLVGLLASSSPVPTQLLSMRCLANMACFEPGKKALSSTSNRIISSVASLTPFSNKNLEIAAATLFINFSTIFKDTKNLEDQCQLLSGIGALALSASDSEAQFRILVAIGTLLTCGKNVVSFASSLDLKPVVEKFALTNNPQKVGECARHVLLML